MMSAASSGGVLSSVDLIASMICEHRLLERVAHLLAREDHGLRQAGEHVAPAHLGLHLLLERDSAEPTSSLISSAVCWPIRSLYSRLMWLMIASSISSPPTRSDCETTMPPSEITATSVVPPPMSTIMFPVGSADREPGADRGGHRLLDQVRLARAGGQRRLLDGALLDAGDARRDADDDARMREAVLVHLLDEVAEHLLGDVEVGDHAVLQRADRADRPRRAAEHPLRLEPDGVDLAGRWSIATTDGSLSTMPRPRT